MSEVQFRGSFVATITPFSDGRVDENAYRSFIEWQVAQGTDGLVPCGTTGESPTLSHAEHMRVTELCIEAAAGRVPVVAGAGSNSTDEALLLARHAEQVGADGILVVTPYYNKPTQEGLYQHFKAVADAVSIPVLIYNIPGRSVIDMSVETMARLAEIDNIVGVKDASNDPVRPLETRRAIGPDFCQLSGEDASAHGFMACGGHGVISVTANVAPKLCAQFHDLWAEGDVAKALAIHERLMPLHKALFVESSPSPVKYAAERLGLCRGDLRLPMVEVTDATKALVDEALRHAGLID